MAFIPMAPALPYMFFLALTFGFIDGFEMLTINNIWIFGGILIASILIDYFAGVMGVKYGGASRKGITFGILGLIIGLFLLPPFGGLVGLFIGVLVGEYALGKDKTKALKAATGSLLGSISGMLLNIFLAVVFLELFIAFVFFI